MRKGHFLSNLFYIISDSLLRIKSVAFLFGLSA